MLLYRLILSQPHIPAPVFAHHATLLIDFLFFSLLELTSLSALVSGSLQFLVFAPEPVHLASIWRGLQPPPVASVQHSLYFEVFPLAIWIAERSNF